MSSFPLPSSNTENEKPDFNVVVTSPTKNPFHEEKNFASTTPRSVFSPPSFYGISALTTMTRDHTPQDKSRRSETFMDTFSPTAITTPTEYPAPSMRPSMSAWLCPPPPPPRRTASSPFPFPQNEANHPFLHPSVGDDRVSRAMPWPLKLSIPSPSSNQGQERPPFRILQQRAAAPREDSLCFCGIEMNPQGAAQELVIQDLRPEDVFCFEKYKGQTTKYPHGNAFYSNLVQEYGKSLLKAQDWSGAASIDGQPTLPEDLSMDKLKSLYSNRIVQLVRERGGRFLASKPTKRSEGKKTEFYDVGDDAAARRTAKLLARVKKEPRRPTSSYGGNILHPSNFDGLAERFQRMSIPTERGLQEDAQKRIARPISRGAIKSRGLSRLNLSPKTFSGSVMFPPLYYPTPEQGAVGRTQSCPPTISTATVSNPSKRDTE